jgi:peptidoglycan/LPS O-acetylase OafA/YrhL
VAIAMVLLSHVEETMPERWKALLFPLGWFSNGGHGVTIFFVLSGYLITSILVREYDATGRIDIKAFYCRRILRIFPAFYFYFIFIAILAWRGVIDVSRTDLALAAGHLINYAQAIFLLFKIPDPGGSGYWFIGHFWSLSMEEQFYWMWPVTLLFLLRTRWYGLLLALILALPLLRVATYYLIPGLRGQLTMMLHTGSDAIFSGCLLAICLARHPELSRKLMVPPWVIAGLGVYFFRINALITHVMPRGYEIVVGLTLLIAAIVLVMANLLQQEGRTWYHSVLGFPPLVFLGRISYSVYLWQQVFLTSMNTTWLGVWPINLAAALVTGWLSYQFIEIPFIQLKDRYFPAHTKAVAPVAAVATA